MSKIHTLLKTYETSGFYGIKCLLKDKFFPDQTKTIAEIELYLKYFIDKKGIEIGGPSLIFSKEVPIYPVIYSLDGCNFSNQTVWEGNIVEGNNFNYFGTKKGHQYICEASNLEEIGDENYDFLISSHCLEHCANTLKTVKEWLRVVKKGGALLLILPDHRFTFDHHRSITAFEHLTDDLNNDIDESDLTHLTEILELHDLIMDSEAGTKEQFKSRSLNNYQNRCLHHHVFDFDLLNSIYSHCNVEVINMTFVKPYNQIVLGIKR